MNLSLEWLQPIEDAGYEAVHWSEIGHDDDPDQKIIAWAAAHDHVVLTSDLDFGEALARSGRDRPSVVQLRLRDTRSASAGSVVMTAIRDGETALRSGALLTIGQRRTRLKPLPLKL